MSVGVSGVVVRDRLQAAVHADGGCGAGSDVQVGAAGGDGVTQHRVKRRALVREITVRERLLDCVQ